MEPEEKEPSQRPPSEPEFVLQWGSRKRLRCIKSRDEGSPLLTRSSGIRRSLPRMNRRLLGSDGPAVSPRRPNSVLRRKSESTGSENRMSHSPPSAEKDRLYSTRGNGLLYEENSGCATVAGTGGIGVEERGNGVLPRFYISLSNKEKEEDFMAMKGCKLPVRPKKRPKLMQKCLLLVSPGQWLSDLSHERYEVREKKSSRKRIKGLKAMCMETDSE